MATVGNLLYKLADFYNWLYSTLGLKQWQFLIIALAVIVLLALIARIQRKKLVNKVYTIPAVKRSEIIGIQLSGHKAREHGTKEALKHGIALTSEMDEKQMGWTQTTKEWRKLTEQIRQLEREVTKHKRTEEHLKHQITELTTTNQELQSQITEHPIQQETNLPEQADQDTKKEIAESAVRTDEPSQSEMSENETVTKDTNQQAVELIDTDKKTHQEVTEDKQFEKDIKLKSDDVIAETKPSGPELINQHRQEQSLKEETEDSEDLRPHEAPLDVQQLKAISELAKRLRGNNR